MNILKTLKFAAVLSAFVVAGQASALTIGITEGKRDLVDGTTALVPVDVTSLLPGPDIGTLGAGDNIEIYGRIVGAIDNFQFTATTSFIIEWIFEGYTTGGGTNVVTSSGFVNDGTSGSTTKFTLFDGVTPVQGPVTLSTDITLGGTQLIFGVQGPGTYSLQLDGMTSAALYDIRISAVPLPASLPLLVFGLGGLGLMARRRMKRAG